MIEPTEIPDVWLYTPKVFADARGWFREVYSQRALSPQLGDAVFVQDNHSASTAAGTVRGLHFQRPPVPQAKLVHVLRGSVYDVAIDLRAGSPTYGRWISETLTAEGGEQLFVPRGFAHGLCTLEPDTEVACKVDGFYSPECESGFIWNDPTLAIPWPVTPGAAVLSDKDRKLGFFRDFVSPFRYGE